VGKKLLFFLIINNWYSINPSNISRVRKLKGKSPPKKKAAEKNNHHCKIERAHHERKAESYTGEVSWVEKREGEEQKNNLLSLPFLPS